MTATSVLTRPAPARRLPRRDLSWRDNEVVWSVAIGAAPQGSAVRGALEAYLTSNPTSYFARHVDAEHGTWRRLRPAELSDFAGRVVQVSDEPAGDLTTRVTRAHAEPLGDLPFRITLGADWAVLRFSHALGDAGTVWPLFTGLLAPDRLAEFLAAGPEPRYPLPAALWNTFGRNPRRLAAALRAERTALPVQATGKAPFRTGETQVAARRSAPGYRRELARQRKQVAPDASMVGLLIARTMQTAAEQGLRPFPGVGMVADVRRHLPGRRYGSGNFTAGAYLGLADPSDPTCVTAAINEYTASARPLLTLAAMTARADRGPRTEPEWQLPGDGPDCVVSFSHVGRLPWPIDPPELGVVLGKPVGRTGLAVVTFEIGPYVYASVSFDERAVPRTVAETVADTIVGAA